MRIECFDWCCWFRMFVGGTPRNAESGKETYYLVLCGKSAVENKQAARLKHQSSGLKLNMGGDIEQEVSMILYADHVRTKSWDHDQASTFRSELYMEHLTTNIFGRFLLWSPRLSSTHDLVSQNFGDLPVGAVCVADVQSKGRGRGRNTWESPLGCLMFSFTLEMEDEQNLPHLQYVASLAATEAINLACKAKGFPTLDVKIKWPNDLYLNGLKVGGVLCTSTSRTPKFSVSAGVGLNLDNEMPTTCLNTALRQLTPDVGKLTREELLATFFGQFEALYNLFLTQGFGALEELYYRTWLHSDQRVTIEDQVLPNIPNKSKVTIKGLTSSGHLLVVDDERKEYQLHPDENRLDFFKGLLKKGV